MPRQKNEVLYARIPREVKRQLERKADECGLPAATLLTVILSDWILRGSAIPKLPEGTTGEERES